MLEEASYGLNTLPPSPNLHLEKGPGADPWQLLSLQNMHTGLFYVFFDAWLCVAFSCYRVLMGGY